jgi:hypothetical protein
MRTAVAGRTERRPDSDVVWLAVTDSAAGPVEEVLGSANVSGIGERRRRRLGRLAAGAAVALLVAAIAVRATVDELAGRRVAAAPTPASLAAPTPAQSAPALPQEQAAYAPDQLLAMMATPDALYVLTANPPQLALRAPHRAPHLVRAPRSGFAVVDDPAEHLVWVLGRRLDTGSATAYDSRTLVKRARVNVPSPVNGAAVLGGRLWLASDAGVYVVAGPTGRLALIPGSYSYTYAIAADPSRKRVVAVTAGLPGQTYVIDVTNLHVARDAFVPTGRSSVAVVNGMAWVGGFGDAVVWPGQHVVWISYGGGVSCLDPRNGRELASWPDLRGPITSTAGVLYSGTPKGIVTTPLPSRCPG